MRLEQDHIFIKTKHNLKNLNSVWSAKYQSWRFPKSIHALDEIMKFLPDIAHVDAWQEMYSKLSEGRRKLKELKEQPNTEDTPNTEGLRPYQQQDIQYLTSIPNAAVFNQARTGKTPTMIRTIRKRRTMRNVIVCPASLQLNWKKEIERWHPSATVHMYTGTPKQRQQQLDEFHAPRIYPAYLIISKDTLKRDLSALDRTAYDVLVVDEAHFLRNRTTAQTKAVHSLGKQAKHRYALTGTPTVKHPSDIFGILSFLYPSKFTSYWYFIERYFKVYENGFGREVGELKPNREAELKDLIDAMSTQRLRKEVMQWLPEKQYHEHTITLSAAQQKVYKSMADDFIAKMADGTEIDAQNVLTQLIRLRQITNDPNLLSIDAPSAKTDAILDIIENNIYTENTEPIVIMSMFTSYLKHIKPMLEKLGKRVGMIHGEMTVQEKDETVQTFQAGRIDILLCNIISAGTGFTLDKGEVIIFTDKAWNPSDNEQAEDRITPTQKDNAEGKKHFIVSLVCENTVDAYIETILKRKDSLTSIINQCKTIDQFSLFLYN